MRLSLSLLAIACWSTAAAADLQPVNGGTKLSAVWANQGGDKITQDELRKSRGVGKTLNSLWNGQGISLLGAQNEVVDFNLVLEAANAQATNVKVVFNAIADNAGHSIVSRTSPGGDDVFNWVGRPIELFYVRYLQINGLSQLDYQTYDERQIPKRFQRPWTGNGAGTGGWTDRPDHNKFYPDIAVPIELVQTFAVAQGSNQSVWGDIYIPKGTPAGTYAGTITVSENGTVTWQVPVQLRVANFALPDAPSSKTMISYDESNINNELFGTTYIDSDNNLRPRGTTVRDRFHMLAHRHRVSLIGEGPATGNNLPMRDAPAPETVPRLDGSLFTAAHGYDGPGVNTGIGVYSIGNYGTWSQVWGTSQSAIWSHSNNWVNWFDANLPAVGVDYFLYLIDESSNYAQTDGWAQTMKANPGSGRRLRSMATVGTLQMPQVPNVMLPTGPAGALCVASQGEQITSAIINDPNRRLWQYNSQRPATGSFATEDDGVSPRQLAWCQFKKHIDRWFYWDATVWNVNADSYTHAQTWGSDDHADGSLGRTGYSYDNGNGVLVYPGRQTRFPGDSYNVDGLFASLRLKHWRRGLEDTDYLTIAAKINPAQVQAIVNQMVPKVLWEIGCSDPNDPSWILADISWSIDPDAWENARKQIAAIIDPGLSSTVLSQPPTTTVTQNPPPPTTVTQNPPPPTTPTPTQTRSPYNGVAAAIPGTIEAENFDNGGEGLAYHDADAANNGGSYRATAVDIRACVDAGGGYQVGWFGGGEWMEYTVNVAAAGSYDLAARVAEGDAGATIHIAMDGADVTGPMAVPNTGSYDTFQSITKTGVKLAAGQHVMRIACDAGNVDVNYVRATASVIPRGPFGGTARAIPGTIQAEDFDEGGEGVAYHDSDTANNGGAYRQTAVDIRACVDAGGGYQVGWFGPGEWLEYTVNVATAGTYDIAARVAEGDAAATVHVAIDGTDRTGPMAVANTGSYDTFRTIVKTGVPLTAGQHIVRLACDAANVDVNWLSFAASAAPTASANVLINPGFEADGRDIQNPAAWGEWAGSAGTDADASYAEAYGGAHSGGWHGTHWKPTAYEVYTWQQPTGIANGVYELSAWVKGSGGQAYGWMEAKDFGGAKLTMNVPATQAWTRIVIPNIQVVNDQCTVGFYSKAGAGQWLYFDDVQLVRTDAIVSGMTYKLVAKHSGKCLDVSGASGAASANVQQWPDNGSTAQQWRVDALADGSFTLTAACSKDELDVAMSSLVDGGNVLQYPNTGKANQHWRIEYTGAGYYRLINVNSGKCLDVAGISTADGANVQQWTYLGGDNQRWALVPVTPTSFGMRERSVGDDAAADASALATVSTPRRADGRGM